jgi:hypothetical protein
MAQFTLTQQRRIRNASWAVQDLKHRFQLVGAESRVHPGSRSIHPHAIQGRLIGRGGYLLGNDGSCVTGQHATVSKARLQTNPVSDLEREGHKRHSSGGNCHVADPSSGLRPASRAAVCLALSSELQRQSLEASSTRDLASGDLGQDFFFCHGGLR